MFDSRGNTEVFKNRIEPHIDLNHAYYSFFPFIVYYVTVLHLNCAVNLRKMECFSRFEHEKNRVLIEIFSVPDKRHYSFFRRPTRKLYLLVSKHGCTNIHAAVQIVRPFSLPSRFPSYSHFTSTKCDIVRDRVEILFWDLIFQHFRSNPDFLRYKYYYTSSLLKCKIFTERKDVM